MTAIDITLLFIALCAVVTGAIKGFVHQMGTIAGLLFGILACRIFGSDLADWAVSRGTEHAGLLRAMVYCGLFLVVFLCLACVARLLGAILSSIKLRGIDRIGGAVFRLALWMLIVSLLLNVYLGICPNDRSRFEVPSKPWRGIVVDMAPKLLGYIAN